MAIKAAAQHNAVKPRDARSLLLNVAPYDLGGNTERGLNWIGHDLESTYGEITNLVKINIGVPALIDRIVLPQMLSRKNGLIMNMGSASAKTPVGALPLYGASK